MPAITKNRNAGLRKSLSNVAGLILKPLPFPFQLDEFASPVFLEAFHPHAAGELYKLIVSDRKNKARKSIWPGLNSLKETTKLLKQNDISDENSEAFDYFIRLRNRKLIGSFHVHTLSWYNSRTEVGYWCHHQFEGRGLVTAALKLVEDHLKAVGFHRVEIRCSGTNLRSSALARRNRYKREGLLRENTWNGSEFEDSVVFAKLFPAAKNRRSVR